MYGDSESSDSEIEDEDGELVTPAIENQILKTISLIKSKDPSVYDSSKSFFSGNFFPLIFTLLYLPFLG
jgi:protein KRI1